MLPVAHPLRRQVAILCVGFSLLAYSAIWYSGRLTYAEHVRQLEAETSSMAATVVAYMNRNLEAADVLAAIGSRNPSVQRLDPDGAADVLRLLAGGQRRGAFRNALLADRTGRVVAWAEPPDAALENTIDPSWLRSVLDEPGPVTSRMLGRPGDAAHAIVLAYPVHDAEGTAVGVLGLSVHLEALERVLRSIPLPPGSVVTLTDERSVVVARSLDADKYVGRPVEAPGQSREPANVPASIVRTGIDGVERAFGNAVVQRGPWLASVGIPTTVAMGRATPIQRRNLAIMGALMVTVLTLSLVVARRWLKAFDHLDAAARRVAIGDLTPLAQLPMPTAEMDHLQRTLSGMILNLHTARTAIDAQVEDERRVRQEVESLQQQVIRQERLAAIGVLVSGVAHELNNPLQAIVGFAELLHMRRDLPETARAELTLIQKESARASAIIRNLTRFGRQSSEPSAVRLRDVIASVMELRQRKLDELRVHVSVDEQSQATVMAIFTELQQVLLNLVINAEQAIVQSAPATRRIAIRTVDRGRWARLELEDSGPGVPPDDEAKLFQPFFTTKPVGVGTGLGLSVSYGIVQALGGCMGYHRAPSGGAVFYFELPIGGAAPGSPYRSV